MAEQNDQPDKVRDCMCSFDVSDKRLIVFTSCGGTRLKLAHNTREHTNASSLRSSRLKIN